MLVAAALGPGATGMFLATGGAFGPGGDHPGGGPGGVLGPSASGGGGPGGVPGFEIGLATLTGDEASGIPKPGGVCGMNLLDLGGGVFATNSNWASRNGTGTVVVPLDDVAMLLSTLGGVLFNWVFVF